MIHRINYVRLKGGLTETEAEITGPAWTCAVFSAFMFWVFSFGFCATPNCGSGGVCDFFA